MAIYMMCPEAKADQPNVRTVRDYPGYEEGRIQHAEKCPKHGQQDLSGALSDCCVREGFQRCYGPFGPLFIEETHVGRVLATGEYNGYHDSDFYALVWDDEKGSTDEVIYASTRGWTYPNGATVDADEQTRAKYDAYLDRLEASRARNLRIKNAKEAIARAEADHNAPEHGKRMRVHRSYKEVKAGMEGIVFFVKRRYSGSLSVGLRTSDRKEGGRYVDVFWANGSQLCNVAPFEAPEELAEELAEATR